MTADPSVPTPSSHKGSSPADTGSWMDRLASALQRRREPGSRLGCLLRWLGRMHLLVQLGGVLLVFAILLAMKLVGEQNLSFAALLYAPGYLWLAPLAMLFPLCVLTPQRWVCVLHLALAAYLLGPFLGWKFGAAPGASSPADGNVLTILSNNRGQKGGDSMSDFIREQQPDIMLFQEAGNRAANYLRGYPEYTYAKSDREFTLVSKFPIRETKTLYLGGEMTPEGRKNGYLVANRAVVDWNGRDIAIYNVHLPTPRDVLLSMRGPAILLGVLPLQGERWEKARTSRSRFWDRKTKLTQELRDLLAGEDLPFIVAGDFNMPNQGWLYRDFTAGGTRLQDSHLAAGSGYGFTFPGTGNVLTMGEPWLRIDYIFTGPMWDIQSSVTEPKRAAQHRALAAQIRLRGPGE